MQGSRELAHSRRVLLLEWRTGETEPVQAHPALSALLLLQRVLLRARRQVVPKLRAWLRIASKVLSACIT